MSYKIENCPYCHQKMIKGAMRCVACGKILQTPEEQIATIEKLQSKQKFNMNRFLNRVLSTILCKFGKRVNWDVSFLQALTSNSVPFLMK